MLELQYLGTRTFVFKDKNGIEQEVKRACFLNPITDRVHTCDPECITGTYNDGVCHRYVVTSFDFKQGGFINIKAMEVFV